MRNKGAYDILKFQIFSENISWTSPYEYSNERVDPLSIPSQFFIYIVYEI